MNVNLQVSALVELSIELPVIGIFEPLVWWKNSWMFLRLGEIGWLHHYATIALQKVHILCACPVHVQCMSSACPCPIVCLCILVLVHVTSWLFYGPLKELFVNDSQPDELDNSFVYRAADGLSFASDHFMNRNVCCRLGAQVRPILYYITVFCRLQRP